MMMDNPSKSLYLREIFTIRVAVMINLGWATIASILGVAVCFKKFGTHFDNESVWAIAMLCVAFCIYAFNSWKYGQFLFGGVYCFTMFTLFDKYNKLYNKSKIY